MRLLLVVASACAIGKRTQIKRARRSEAEAKALPHCNATDLALGLPGGVWRAAPDRRASGFGADAAPGAAPDQYARPVHDFAPATCRLRRFDARDFAGRCAAGRRVAFLGDSLGEQVWKALLGLLAHGGARAERAACGPGCAADRFAVAGARLDVLERFKVSRFDGAALDAVDAAARFRAGDVVLLSFGAHYRNASHLAADVWGLLRWIAAGPSRRRATWVWRETSPSHFPVPSGAYEDMVACPACLRWPLRCRRARDLGAQRWRVAAAAPALDAAAFDLRTLPLWELLKAAWRAHPGAGAPLRLEEDCGGDAGRLRVRATASKGTCALDCLHLAPRYNHLAARLLYHALCFDETGRPTPLGG